MNYLAFTYAKEAFSQMQGPRLGGASSGPLINRTVIQWLYGWRDPLVSALSPSGLNSSSPWWSYDVNLQLAMRPLSDAARWGQLAAAVGNGTAPAGAASRFHHFTMATGTDAVSAAGTLLLDNGLPAVPHPGGDVAVRGKFAGKWGFGDLALLPFGLPLGTMQPQWYFGRLDMSPDPGTGVGLGRTVPMSWDGSAPAMRMHIPTAIFSLAPDTLTPCGGAAANSSVEASVAARGACVTGDYVSGVWNLSSRVGGAPLFMSRAHFYGADPAMAASLGSGAAAMAPDESTHNLRARNGQGASPLRLSLTHRSRCALTDGAGDGGGHSAARDGRHAVQSGASPNDDLLPASLARRARAGRLHLLPAALDGHQLPQQH